MPTAAIIEDIHQLFATGGAAQYDGEPVTQLEHALQTAHLAEQASDDEAAAFIVQRAARDAIVLRVWDDLAKRPGLETPPLAHFLERAARCASLPVA